SNGNLVHGRQSGHWLRQRSHGARWLELGGTLETPDLRLANLRRKWSTIPKAAAFHNQPSHFAVWRLFVSRRVTLTTHGSSGCRVPLKWNGDDYASTPSGSAKIQLPLSLAFQLTGNDALGGRHLDFREQAKRTK